MEAMIIPKICIPCANAPVSYFLWLEGHQGKKSLQWNDQAGAWLGEGITFGCIRPDGVATLVLIVDGKEHRTSTVFDSKDCIHFGDWRLASFNDEELSGKIEDFKKAVLIIDHETWQAKPTPVSAPAIRRVRKVACISLGDWTGELIECLSCQGTVKLKIMSCNIHKKCTLEKPLHGVQCCQLCKDYNPKSVV